MLPSILEQLEAARQHAIREAAMDTDDRSKARKAYRAKWERDRRAGKIEVQFRANKSRDHVLNVIKAACGPIHRGTIIAQAGLSSRVVEDRIDELLVQNRIARVRRGWYISKD